MEHFFNLVGILIFSCAVQFFYFTNLVKISKKDNVDSELTDSEKIDSEITDEELSPENFKNFSYYIEKFSN